MIPDHWFFICPCYGWDIIFGGNDPCPSKLFSGVVKCKSWFLVSWHTFTITLLPFFSASLISLEPHFVFGDLICVLHCFRSLASCRVSYSRVAYLLFFVYVYSWGCSIWGHYILHSPYLFYYQLALGISLKSDVWYTAFMKAKSMCARCCLLARSSTASFWGFFFPSFSPLVVWIV